MNYRTMELSWTLNRLEPISINFHNFNRSCIHTEIEFPLVGSTRSVPSIKSIGGAPSRVASL